MKLKTIALAVLMAANGAAHAAPTMQTCAPMEITHNGNSGLSYSLSCDAGGWSMKYTGAIPAGNDAVLARYRVQVRNPDGTSFANNRSVRLPAPNLLGQALAREAVLLDNGDLALRDCVEFSCTLYRPLGNAEKLAQATITVTPEIKRLTDDAARLNVELTKRQSELAAQGGKVAALQMEVSSLTAKLGGAEQNLANAKSTLESAREQYAADIDGLMSSSKADVAKVSAADHAESSAQIAKLNEQLASVNGSLDAARKELAECSAAHGAAEAAKATADREVEARGKQVADLQASLRATEAELKRVLDGFGAKVADINGKQVQPAAGASAEVAAARLKVDAANREVERLLTRVAALEHTLAGANQQLMAAQNTQTKNTIALGDAADNQERLRAVLEIALADAQITIAEMANARSTQVGELRAALAEANGKLAAAQGQLGDLAARPVPESDAQSKLTAASTRIDELVSKVAGLEVALDVANKNLEDSRSAQAGNESSFADLHAAYEQNLHQLGVVTAELTQARMGGSAADLAKVNGKLSTTIAERDAAQAELTQLKATMSAIGPKVDRLEAERLSALKGSQKVATEMLDALDQFDALQAAKNDADKALESTTQRVMELTTKLEAANLARGLAMQAATTANADADTQNLKNQELARSLLNAQKAATSQHERIEHLEGTNAAQVAEIAALRKQLEEQTGSPAPSGK